MERDPFLTGCAFWSRKVGGGRGEKPVGINCRWQEKERVIL
jgi:hypothetical protein